MRKKYKQFVKDEGLEMEEGRVSFTTERAATDKAGKAAKKGARAK